MEHSPWVGPDYPLGLDGQRIAIVGYSHWLDENEDGPEFTKKCVSNVISGKWKLSFFTQIRNYFGYQDHHAFWSRVMFFNYLPDRVGNQTQRFMHGTDDQRRRAKDRFLRCIGEQLPLAQKVFVFTSRRWAFPFDEESFKTLGPTFPNFRNVKYQVGGNLISIFFLRHPQGADGEVMRMAINCALKTSNFASDAGG